MDTLNINGTKYENIIYNLLVKIVLYLLNEEEQFNFNFFMIL